MKGRHQRSALTAAIFMALAVRATWAGHQTPTTAISISSTQALAFGRFVAGSGGTVTVNPNGARSAAGGVMLVPSSAGAAARFTVAGTPNLTYAITLPANGTASLSNGAGNTMALSNFSSTPASTGQLDAVGRQPLSVGAALSVGNKQPAGSYSGSFDVIVEYN